MYRYFRLDYLGYKLNIPLYGLTIGIGLIISLLLLDYSLKKEEKSYGDKIFFSLVLSFIFGSVLSYFFTTYFLYHNQTSISAISFLPGLLFGVTIFSLILNSFNFDIYKSLNLVCPFVAISLLFGRLGCFLGGCCFGKPTFLVVGVCFPYDSFASIKYGFPHFIHPTQLYEMICISVIIYIIYKINLEYRLLIFSLGYGFSRFFIEFLRGDNRGIMGSFLLLSPSQIMSIILVIIGSTFFLIKKFRNLPS